MPSVSDYCDGIVAQLTALGSCIEQLLQPGASAKRIREAEGMFSFAFPTSLVEMYKWRNGTRLVEGSAFFPWWVFDSLEESLGRYETFKNASDEKTWKANWFPVFSASDVSSIGIVCSPSRAADAEIVWFEYTLGTEVAFVSLEAMLVTISRAYQVGAIFMTDSGEIDLNDSAFAKIARKHNPGVTRWTSKRR
jgi:cell wall assembly regulator SMI1